MTQATDQDNPPASQSFSYDALGRITYNSRLGSYSYPVDGSARPHAPSTAGTNSYSYDADGNLSSGAGRSINWDAENRITQVTVGTTTTAFTYDEGGERLKKVSGSTTSLYPMGDDYEITNGVVTKYISVGALGVVAKRVGSTTYWLHTERLGSIEAITDASAAVVQRRSYRPYGDKLADATSHVESRGWIDQRQDETGLTYLHARYYDPSLGVFASPDPIGTAGGLNEFGYGFNDPINSADRSGLNPNDQPPPVFPVEVHCPGDPGCPGGGGWVPGGGGWVPGGGGWPRWVPGGGGSGGGKNHGQRLTIPRERGEGKAGPVLNCAVATPTCVPVLPPVVVTCPGDPGCPTEPPIQIVQEIIIGRLPPVPFRIPPGARFNPALERPAVTSPRPYVPVPQPLPPVPPVPPTFLDLLGDILETLGYLFGGGDGVVPSPDGCPEGNVCA